VYRAVIGALLALVGVLSPTVAAANPSQDVARARGEFNQGNYKQVIELLVPQLYPKPLIAEEKELKEARYLLAESYFFVDQRDKSEEQFVALLFIDPSFKMEVVLEDPEIYGFFTNIRNERKEELEQLERIKAEAAAAAARPKTQIITDRVIRERSMITNFLPFGAGQFANGHRTKAYVFMGSQMVFGGASLAIFAYQAFQYGVPSTVPKSEADAVRQMQIFQVGFGALFLISYGWSVLDAFYNQRPKVVETSREIPIEKEKPRTTFVVPLLTPDSAGVGVMWEF
jgi:hypothetical protein